MPQLHKGVRFRAVSASAPSLPQLPILSYALRPAIPAAQLSAVRRWALHNFVPPPLYLDLFLDTGAELSTHGVAEGMEDQGVYAVSNGYILTCSGCGRDFMQLNAYSNHTGACRQGKKRNASALEVAQEAYRKKKRLKLDSILAASQPQVLQPSQQVLEPTIEVSL